jgi:hypothetical protein
MGHPLSEPDTSCATDRGDDLNLTWQNRCRMVMRKGRQ